MEFKLLAKSGGSYRYSSEVLLVGALLGSALPYLIVTREDSGHGFAYCFAYVLLAAFLWIDADLLIRWVARG